MKSRRLGTTGPLVPAIGLGCIGMTDRHGLPDHEARAIATIHRALDHGVLPLNVSDNYGPHLNEELIGRALKQPPGEVTVNTKVSQVRYPDEMPSTNSRPDHVQMTCDASLERLGVEVIDIYTQQPGRSGDPH